MYQLTDVKKTYHKGRTVVQALQGVDLQIADGEWLAIQGPTGHGKSTLLQMLGGLDRPSAGELWLAGVRIDHMSERGMAALRRDRVGFVFQSFNLIPRMTALHNVELPLSYAGVKSAERRRRAEAALRLVGLAERMNSQPKQLSGGQQQRVAVARALVTAPALILADEPTGNLDSKASHDLMGVFDRLNAAGRTIVLITHEADVAEHAKRTIQVQDGRIVADHRVTAPGALPPLLTRSAVPS